MESNKRIVSAWSASQAAIVKAKNRHYAAILAINVLRKSGRYTLAEMAKLEFEFQESAEAYRIVVDSCSAYAD